MSRLEIIGTGRRRRFTDEAKLRIIEEGFSGNGRQVSATALKHDVSRSQLDTSNYLAFSAGIWFHRRADLHGGDGCEDRLGSGTLTSAMPG